MPLQPDFIKIIQSYYKCDIGSHTKNLTLFDFIQETKLQERLAIEFYIARYIAKLQEALNLNTNSYELIGHLKFQIIQYAGIYEVIISYLLQGQFSENEDVKKLGEKTEYKIVSALADGVTIYNNQREQLFLCKKETKKTDWIYINFEEKLKTAVKIGLIKPETKESVLEIYKLRHSVHIEKAVKTDIKFEVQQCKKAFLTLINNFIPEIRSYLNSSVTEEMKEEEQKLVEEFEKDMTLIECNNEL